MRVLLVVSPLKSNFQYLVPLAWALRTAGHDVRVAGQPWFADVITQAGLTAVPVGRDSDPWRITEYRPDKLAAMRFGIMAPYDAFDDPAKATWEYLRPGMAEAVRGWHRVGNVPVITGLVEFARHWRPALVIWDPLSFAGAIAAKACGAAHVRLLDGIDVFGGVRQLFLRLKAEQPLARQADPLADWLGGYARKYGGEYTEDMATGHATVDQFPLSLQTEAPDLDYLRMRYIPYGGSATVPAWLQKPPTKPRVALTMGLAATEIYRGYTINTQDILTALADLDIELVATIAESEQKKLTHVPNNARIVSYAPWHALAPTCAAVIHHAGAATLATTARHPVPHLALHHHNDQPILGRKLADHGAGLELHTTEATGPLVRESLLRLLTEPLFTQRAADLAAEIHALPTPNQLVPDLEQLAEKHHTPLY
ncbi:activator-dependent family glycosyltransferase [Actinokineospora sp.]|uniref:activator-dependent family glycosyltransferase n=1 Tax=Actinokineospora sp. TaxID=1872133 RepID=UPI0040378A30